MLSTSFIHKALGSDSASDLTFGVCFGLAFLLVRWGSLIDSMLWSGVMLLAASGGFFAIARLWRYRDAALPARASPVPDRSRMMTNKLSQSVRTLLAGAVCLSILCGMLVVHAWPLWTGQSVLLPVTPIDPRDFFRGEYVRLDTPATRLTVRSEGQAPAGALAVTPVGSMVGRASVRSATDRYGSATRAGRLRAARAARRSRRVATGEHFD